jgi:YbgC/YbaW family acyl-CoA thioester hydrolase
MNTKIENKLPARADFRFFDRLRVRWAEVDMQKIVFNGHYLMYLDTAVAAYWRALAVDYSPAMHAMGGDLYVKKATLEYHASARMDDLLDVGMRCKKIGNSSMVFEGGVFCGPQLLVSGELVYVFADPATQTSRPVPQALRDLLNGFEAGEPMVNVQTGPWAELGSQAATLRHAVFVAEQGFAAEDEVDEADALPSTTHAVAVNRLGEAVATGRLLATATPGVMKVGRMATLRVLRGGGLAKQVLQALEAVARTQGARQLLLHAQTQAVPFYLRQGYAAQGDVFTEDGAPHQRMAKILG